uniref:Uncharacterized protein n=1 Tax=Anopheles atroparvus TaxID=41427 RepID=A0A182JHB5_ANOAO
MMTIAPDALGNGKRTIAKLSVREDLRCILERGFTQEAPGQHRSVRGQGAGCLVSSSSSWSSQEEKVPISGEGHRRWRRTMGAGASFINCLAIGESPQRICSHDLDLLEAIERQQKGGNRSCPEGKVFHRQCNVCKCRRNGAFECSTDLCGEDFFDPTGLPRYW